MGSEWNPDKVKDLMKPETDTYVCDALLKQHLFAGVGNIIKNEVLFRTRIQPLSKVGSLPAKKLSELIKQSSQ